MIIKVNKIVESGDRSVGFGKYTQVNNRYNKALRSDCGYNIWTNGSSISDERMVSQGMSHCSASKAYYSKGVGNYLTTLATDKEEDTPSVRVDESYKSTAYICSNGINRELVEVPTLDSTINKSSPIPNPDSSISKPSSVPTTSTITFKSSSTPVSTCTKGYCGFKADTGKVDDCCSSVMAV